MSDEVIRRTRDRLNESGPQTSPTNALQELRDALEVRVTVSKEAPYDMIYSPVLVLTARAKTPAEAKLTVDTWALECVSTAKQNKDARHVPLVEALQGQTDAMLARLEEAEARVEAFRRDNNLEYIQNRLSGLITLTTGYLDRRADAEQDLSKERARHESLAASGSGVNRTQELAFTVPAEFLALLRKPLGLSGEDTVETKKQDLSATWEVLDPMYQQAARSGADAAGYEARLLMIDEALKAFNTELPNLQAEMARISRTDNELTRDAEILREAFGNAALQFEYAKLLAGLDHSELQLLSEGAEWRLSPFRRAIIMGCGGALWGFILAAAVSLLARIVVQPALESSE